MEVELCNDKPALPRVRSESVPNPKPNCTGA